MHTEFWGTLPIIFGVYEGAYSRMFLKMGVFVYQSDLAFSIDFFRTVARSILLTLLDSGGATLWDIPLHTRLFNVAGWLGAKLFPSGT